MLFPLAPHIASELWERFGHKEWIDYAAWVLAEKELTEWIAGKTIVKKIFVQNKLMNIVVK
jgi:leucyl-tRNA synthetase